jgi:hypothetical protein
MTTDDPGVIQVSAESYARSLFRSYSEDWEVQAYRYRLPPLSEVIALLKDRSQEVVTGGDKYGVLRIEVLADDSIRLTKMGERSDALWSFCYSNLNEAAAKIVEENYNFDEELRRYRMTFYVDAGTFSNCRHSKNLYQCPICIKELPDSKKF